MKKQKSADKHQLKDDLQSDIKAKLMEMKSQLKEEDEKRQEREKQNRSERKKSSKKTKALKNSLMKAKWIGININKPAPIQGAGFSVMSGALRKRLVSYEIGAL